MRGYISDTEARRLGLHKLPRPIISPRSLGRPAHIKPAHMASVLRELLKRESGTHVKIRRELVCDCLALCAAVIEAAP